MGNISFDALTKFIEPFENSPYTKCAPDHSNDDLQRYTKRLPFVDYSSIIEAFTNEVYRFITENSNYGLNHYYEILLKNHIEWNSESMRGAEVSLLDAQCVLALIVGAIRSERFCDGSLLSFLEDGSVIKWLMRLKQIQERLS